MFHMSWTSPYRGEVKTLKLTRDPFLHGLGHYTDTDGNVWDVYAIYGKGYAGHSRPYINARPVSQHPGYYSTASSQGFSLDTGSGGNGSNELIHTWIPYYVEVPNRAARRAR